MYYSISLCRFSSQLIRAQSLFLAVEALVLPGINFYSHCQNFRRTANSVAEKHVFEGGLYSHLSAESSQNRKGYGMEWKHGGLSLSLFGA